MPSIPVYVTREKTNGQSGYFSLALGLAVWLFILIVANVGGWSIYGLVILAEKVVNLFG